MGSFLRVLHRRNVLAERHALAHLPQIMAAHNRSLRGEVFPLVAMGLVSITAIGTATFVNTRITVGSYLVIAVVSASMYCVLIWQSFPVYRSPFVHVSDWRRQFKRAAPVLGSPYLLYLRSFKNERTVRGKIFNEEGYQFSVIGPDDALLALGLGRVIIGVKHPLTESENDGVPILPILHDDWKIDVERLIINAMFIVVAVEKWGEGIAEEFTLIEKHKRQTNTLLIKSRSPLPIAIDGFRIVERRDVFPNTQFDRKDDLVLEYADQLAPHIPLVELGCSLVPTLGLQPLSLGK